MYFLFTVLVVCCAVLLVAGVIEQRRHFTNLEHIPTRVLVNGIRGKSSITRLCAGALRGGDLTTVAKTTGTAARFIHPDATEEPVYRKFGIANVVEQIGIVRRAAAYNPDALVIECMAVMPALQEINQSKLIRSTIGVLCNVREDHLAEMGPTLDDVARSLSRSMPENGICVTAEKDRFDILKEEADARNCELIYADPETVTDDELRGFSWFTFKENVAIALKVAELLGVGREVALQGMYDAPPDPGVLSVERYVTEDHKKLRFANVFAANDPESTLMNINQLLDLGAIHRPLNVVINCRPDRVERNGQMGEIIPDLQPEKVFVIGHPAKSAIDAIPAEWRSRAVDLGGDRRDPEEFMGQLLGQLGPDSSLVAIGNIHGQGEVLLEHLAELPADESEDPATAPAAAPAQGAAPAEGVVERTQPTPLYEPHIDPYQHYPEAYENRYAHHQLTPAAAVHVPAQRTAEQPYGHQYQHEQQQYDQHQQHQQYAQQQYAQQYQQHEQQAYAQQQNQQPYDHQPYDQQPGQQQYDAPYAAQGHPGHQQDAYAAHDPYGQQAAYASAPQGTATPHEASYPSHEAQPPRQPEPEEVRPRGLFEPRVPPVSPAADDTQQWHSPGEPR
ncbi:Capsule biosynthesis protein CapB [Streptomyces sp. YIM 121038]|uniref:poly-gamma-glutamate synthase PgsB n=1 Tax=Streptomyces sp. YIM 121038 TaxID=2136401 RepID=UPI0011100BA5|nr:poly-gamma-glutamate synthase PgsB [Streptomyces sp. YIM 121038]QCX79716.1 Capsule biosynthesis protein CapB [Streptomyces sp. YIM 121038]